MKLIDILDATPFPIGYRIAFITNFMREPLLRQMERDKGVIRPELTVLMCLSYKNDLNARDICEITEQPSNTVSRAVTSLQAKGMLTREMDAHDTRRRVLNITELGRHTHDEIIATFAATEERMLTVLTTDERNTLEGLLDKIARSVDTWRL